MTREEYNTERLYLLERQEQLKRQLCNIDKEIYAIGQEYCRDCCKYKIEDKIIIPEGFYKGYEGKITRIIPKIPLFEGEAIGFTVIGKPLNYKETYSYKAYTGKLPPASFIFYIKEI